MEKKPENTKKEREKNSKREGLFFKTTLPILQICEITLSIFFYKNNPAFVTRALHRVFTLKVLSDSASLQKLCEDVESLGAFSVAGDLTKFFKN